MNLRRSAAALAVLFAGAVLSAGAQVVPSAEAGGLPIVAGAGASLFNMDWGHDQFGQPRYMEGVTGWVDWNLTRLPGPALLRGLSVEIELRDISFGEPNSLSNANVGDKSTNLRQDTGLGGVIYTWRHYRRGRWRAWAASTFRHCRRRRPPTGTTTGRLPHLAAGPISAPVTTSGCGQTGSISSGPIFLAARMR